MEDGIIHEINNSASLCSVELIKLFYPKGEQRNSAEKPDIWFPTAQSVEHDQLHPGHQHHPHLPAPEETLRPGSSQDSSDQVQAWIFFI